MNELSEKTCKACEGGVSPLSASEIETLLKQIPEWKVDDQNLRISKSFEFKNYYHTIAFVNAVAWISHHENHHPDLEVGYKQCVVKYTTHAIKGLSENDFICAAKIEKLF